MILQIDKDLLIATDAHNFMLRRKRNSNGRKERWQTLCYCKTLDGVLECVRDERIKGATCESLEDFSRCLQALACDIREIGQQCVNLWGQDRSVQG